MNGMTSITLDILRRIETWPQEDQEELAEAARDIEARRTGVYRATQDELRALDEAERSGRLLSRLLCACSAGGGIRFFSTRPNR
jgi:hypothetical protein